MSEQPKPVVQEPLRAEAGSEERMAKWRLNYKPNPPFTIEAEAWHEQDAFYQPLLAQKDAMIFELKNAISDFINSSRFEPNQVAQARLKEFLDGACSAVFGFVNKEDLQIANQEIERLKEMNRLWVKWLYVFVKTGDGESLLDGLNREHGDKFKQAYDHGQNESALATSPEKEKEV